MLTPRPPRTALYLLWPYSLGDLPLSCVPVPPPLAMPRLFSSLPSRQPSRPLEYFRCAPRAPQLLRRLLGAAIAHPRGFKDMAPRGQVLADIHAAPPASRGGGRWRDAHSSGCAARSESEGAICSIHARR
jgi:hypothetical protein